MTQINDLPDKEFKITIIKMLSKIKKAMQKQ